jgi:glycine/D-amino acid oxidase-like deaminating enzyme
MSPAIPSLWARRSLPAPGFTPLAGTRCADVAVVGGGILGASLALHLAEAGVSAVLLEAEEPGFGATGRNTGFLVPAFPFAVGPERARTILGGERGEALSRMIAGAGDLVLGLVQRLGLDCEAEGTGWLTTAVTAEREGALVARQREWEAVGKRVELLGREETRRLSGSPHYRAALLDRSGGQLNPLAYVRGLAVAAERAGAAIHAASRVTAIEKTARGWRLVTAGGEVEAERVILAANALIGRLAPEVARSLYPVVVHQVATAPLAEAHWQRIMPERHCVTDTRRDQAAYRLTTDNRLITGGPAAVPWGADARMARGLLQKLVATVPDAAPLAPDLVWTGTVAVTPDFLPRAFSIAPGLTALLGCNGRGIAMTTALGRATARWITTGDERELPLRPAAPSPIPFHALMQHAPRAWIPLARWRDARDERMA